MPKISIEATFGLLFEVAVGILDHLHIGERWIIWGLFAFGLVLLSDSVIRSDWVKNQSLPKTRLKRRILGMLPVVAGAAIFGFLIFGRTRAIESEVHPSPTTSSPTIPPQDLSGIQNSLDEVNKNLSRMGRSGISAAQMEVIKEVEQFLVGRDEYSLREMFGFPLMMEKNIRMNVLAISHYKKGTPFTTKMMQENFIGTQTIQDIKLAEGHIRRYGGAFLQTPMDGTNIYALMLPDQFTDGKKKLLKLESSPELPSFITKEIKGFDKSIDKNATDLLHVLNSALKKDPNYFLQYDDVSSPQYFHQIDAMWLDHFTQLEPQANKIRDAIHKYLGVK